MSTIASSSGELTSNRSRSDAWLSAKSRPTAARSSGGQRGDRGLDPGVLGHDVLGAPERDRVEAIAGRREAPRASRRAGFGWTGRSRASSATAASHWLRRTLYAEPSRWRAEPVWQTTRARSAGSGIGRHVVRPAVEQQRRAGHAARLGELVHEAALDADEAVLGALADPGERERVDCRGGRRRASPRPRPARSRPTTTGRRWAAGSTRSPRAGRSAAGRPRRAPRPCPTT